MKPLYLIGLPGSGKTTVGKQLAEKFGFEFIDLDKEIERKQGRSIPEIFSAEGESGFRKIESQVLRDTVGTNKDHVIIATGGGTPCFHNNMEFINRTGYSVYLDLSMENILNNLEKEPDSRPLFKNLKGAELEEKLFQLKQSRVQYYEQSRVVWAFEAVTMPDLYTLVADLFTKLPK